MLINVGCEQDCLVRTHLRMPLSSLISVLSVLLLKELNAMSAYMFCASWKTMAKTDYVLWQERRLSGLLNCKKPPETVILPCSYTASCTRTYILNWRAWHLYMWSQCSNKLHFQYYCCFSFLIISAVAFLWSGNSEHQVLAIFFFCIWYP